MLPISGPRSQTDADLKSERERFNRNFDAAFLPSNEEVMKAVLIAVGILASIILLPLLCSLGVR